MTSTKSAVKLSDSFAETLFDDVPDYDLEELSECEINEIVEAHKELCGNRKTGQTLIDIGKTDCVNAAHTRSTINIVCDDHPFLLDSIVSEVNRHKLLIDYLIHPSVNVIPDKNGTCNIQSKASDESVKQNHLYIRLHRLIPKTLAEELKQGLLNVIADVILATDDWTEMRERTWQAREDLLENASRRAGDIETLQEYAEFLTYVHDHNFTLLGYREYTVGKNGTIKHVPEQGLGLLTQNRTPDFLKNYEDDVPELLEELRSNDSPLKVFKINRDSTVHRRVPMDAIAIKIFGDNGEVTGFRLLIGLFTSVTYSRSVGDIPYLSMKINAVLEKTDFPAGSHDDKALRHILEKYPRDELFQTSVEELQEIALSILSLQERQRIALFLRRDPLGRAVSCLLYIPRERYDTRIRQRFAQILEEEIGGHTAAFYTTLDDSVFARVIYIVETNRQKIGDLDHDAIEDKLQEAGRAWDEMLAAELNARYGSESEKYIEAYTEAFPVGYRERYKIAAAMYDIDKLEQLNEDHTVEFDLYRPTHYTGNSLRLKMFMVDQPAVLSDVLPILEKLGLRVIAELPYEIKVRKDEIETYWIHDFLIESARPDLAIEVEDIKPLFEEAFRRVWLKKMKNGSLNELVISAQMNWREVVILRTYVHYIRQLNLPYSQPYVADALTDHPHIARLLVDLFCTMHNPDLEKGRAEKEEEYKAAILQHLEAVESLDQDKILRVVLTLVNHTLRTNFFQPDESGCLKDYLSIKLESDSIDEVPAPKPYREIFVYSPRTEGIHLRGGPIARGGIRWSDRQEDYRTEVLGLMKAQMVKNSVIVPVGAKGGFILKQPPVGGDRGAIKDEGIACYKIFIRGLLDLTDNRKGTKVVPPKCVHRRDGDDPYLVVAADKGTATFSDTANALSREYDFWLDDAFASGGSAGYDHKEMGITARGAWESVRRHFAELNHDIQSQDFSVVGIGDMGGDVFGNGMLLSEHIRLIGAFNHLHIFCDPDPDIAVSFAERQRLFEEARGWDGYDTSKLSAGGRIYSRFDKKLKLTPEIKAAFHIEADNVSPYELMRAMLTARADLLWFGGIGTYVKASSETHGDVGDKSNDPIRVNAADMQGKVIGEGANLGITQLGRIEFALNGGRINADFIDNSGGVDSSDHEVNIKILLKNVMEEKGSKLDMKSRNKLLESMTEDVAEHVLAHNFHQAQAISLMEFQAHDQLGSQGEFIDDLERHHNLNRKLEGLPADEEIERRMRAGKGLTRPELAVLQSYAKIMLTNDLLDSDIPDNKETQEWVYAYFPHALRKKYAEEIHNHRLRREIIATMMANQITNRMGPVFVKQHMNKTGASAADVCRAYLLSVKVFGLEDICQRIEAGDHNALAYVRLRALKETASLAGRLTTWFLNQQDINLDMSACCEAYGPRVETLRQKMPELLPQGMKDAITSQKEAYVRDGLPEDLAGTLAQMPYMASSCDIVKIALSRKSKNDLELIGGIYFELGEEFRLNWLRQKAAFLDADDHWMSEARDGLIEQLYEVQAELTLNVLRDIRNKSDDVLTQWREKHSRDIDKLAPLLESLQREGQFDLAKLSLAEQRLRHLYHG